MRIHDVERDSPELLTHLLMCCGFDTPAELCNNPLLTGRMLNGRCSWLACVGAVWRVGDPVCVRVLSRQLRAEYMLISFQFDRRLRTVSKVNCRQTFIRMISNYIMHSSSWNSRAWNIFGSFLGSKTCGCLIACYTKHKVFRSKPECNMKCEHKSMRRKNISNQLWANKTAHIRCTI